VMRKLTTVGLFLLGAILILLIFRVDSRLALGSVAPSFTLKNEDGVQVSLSDYTDHVVLVNFWATWCPPCLKEMPSLEKLYQNFKDEPFALLAINEEGAGAQQAVAHFKKKIDIHFPILFDDGEVAAKYDAHTLPHTFLIGKKGEIVKKIVGDVDWVSQEYIQIVEELLGEN